MPCITGPTVPPPSLQSPFSIEPPAPPDIPLGDAELCCKLPPVSIPKPPIPIPKLIVNVTLVKAAQEVIKTVTDFLDSLPSSCPKE